MCLRSRARLRALEQQPAQSTLHFPWQDGGMTNDAIKERINIMAGRREGEADGALSPAQMLHFAIMRMPWVRLMRGGEKWWKNKVSQWKPSRRQKEETWSPGLLWPVEERRWQAASLLSFKCQWLNLSSFVLRSFKMLSHGLWSLRLCRFNWIRW